MGFALKVCVIYIFLWDSIHFEIKRADFKQLKDSK